MIASTHKPAIGTLRFLFAVAVIYSHTFFLGGLGSEPLQQTLFAGREFFGGFAVKGFFILSGFLIVQSELRLNDTRRFLWHRCLRILPALWICLAVTAFVIAPLMDSASARWNLPDAWHYVVWNLGNPREQVNIGGLPAGVAWSGDLNGSLWTLQYELACYIAVALLGWVGVLRQASRITALLGSAIFLLFAWDHLGATHPLFFKIPERDVVAYFALGGVVAVLGFERFTHRMLNTVGIVALVCLAISYRIGATAWLTPIALTIVVLWCATQRLAPDMERRLGGDYSYGLYIYAYPIQQLLAVHHVQRWGATAFFGLSLLITLSAAAVSWHVIEKVALRGKDWRKKRRSAPIANSGPVVAPQSTTF